MTITIPVGVPSNITIKFALKWMVSFIATSLLSFCRYDNHLKARDSRGNTYGLSNKIAKKANTDTSCIVPGIDKDNG